MTPRFYEPGHLVVGSLPTSIFYNVVGIVTTIRTDCETDLFNFGYDVAALPPYAVRPLNLGDRIDTTHHA